jgi:hypothetical protein
MQLQLFAINDKKIYNAAAPQPSYYKDPLTVCQMDATAISCKDDFFKDIYPHPFVPPPARDICNIPQIFWLERGVRERGGFAPSQILSPSQTTLNPGKKIALFERGSGGEYS